MTNTGTAAKATRTSAGLTITTPAGKVANYGTAKSYMAAAAVTFSELADGSWVATVNKTLKAAGKPYKYGNGNVVVVEVTEG